MMVRTPLPPCSRPSHNMVRSQTCQNGEVHLPATKAKSMPWTPSPSHRFTNRWPKTRMTSRTPDMRMNSHDIISPLRPRWPVRRYRVLGSGIVEVVISSSEHVHQVAGQETGHEREPHDHHAPEQLAVVPGPPGPEVHQDDAQAVERVEDDRADQPYLAQTEDDRLVEADDLVVRLGGHPHQCEIGTASCRGGV